MSFTWQTIPRLSSACNLPLLETGLSQFSDVLTTILYPLPSSSTRGSLHITGSAGRWASDTENLATPSTVASSADLTELTFSVQMRTTLESSVTTRSTHLRLGSFSRPICFFTIASNAMSGVKRPTC